MDSGRRSLFQSELYLCLQKAVYHIIRSALFILPPETAHRLTLFFLHIVLRIPVVNQIFIHRQQKGRSTIFCGLNFPNKTGLAAGFDKNAKHIRDLSLLGFGHIEVGTVTPLAQPGNPKPRLFRLPSDHALINRMGFNNDGVDEMVRNLTAYYNNRMAGDPVPVIGGNIGKNKMTDNEDAVMDYEACYDKLYPLVDYFVINVSSPNTPGLRALQDKEPLLRIILALSEIRSAKQSAYPDLPQRPLFLKIAPDLTSEQLDDVIEIALTTPLDGLIATNTTISRTGLKTPEKRVASMGDGGLSGAPLKEKASNVLHHIVERSGGKVPVIGVGGISSAGEAQERLEAGAGLVQLYTGFIYGGPPLIRKLANL